MSQSLSSPLQRCCPSNLGQLISAPVQLGPRCGYWYLGALTPGIGSHERITRTPANGQRSALRTRFHFAQSQRTGRGQGEDEDFALASVDVQNTFNRFSRQNSRPAADQGTVAMFSEYSIPSTDAVANLLHLISPMKMGCNKVSRQACLWFPF